MSCPQISDSNSLPLNPGKVTLSYILTSPIPTSGKMTVSLTGSDGSKPSNTVDWDTGNSLGVTIPVPFSDMKQGVTYSVTSATYTASGCDGPQPVTGDAVYPDFTIPCPVSDLTPDAISYSTDANHISSFSMTVPSSIAGQVGNDYAIAFNASDKTGSKTMTVSDLRCGLAGTISLKDSNDSCISQVRWETPSCAASVASPVNFKLYKLTCKSFEFSWEYGTGTQPPTIKIAIEDAQGNSLHTDNAWNSNVKTFSSSDYPEIVFTSLEDVYVKITTGTDPSQTILREFYIPECSTYDCPEQMCCNRTFSEEHYYKLVLVVLLYISYLLLLKLYNFLRLNHRK